MTLLGFLILLLILSLGKMFLFSRNAEWAANEKQKAVVTEIRDLDEANQPKQDWLQAHS